MNLRTYLTAEYFDDARPDYYAVAVTHEGGRWMGYFGAVIPEVLRRLRQDFNLGLFQSIEICRYDGDELLHTYLPDEVGMFDFSDFRK